MSGFDVKIDVDGADEIIARYQYLERKVSPAGLRTWLRGEAQPMLRERTADRFANEGDDAAGKWADLAAATGLIRHAQGFPAFHPINVRTGRLRWYALLTYRLKSSAQSASLEIPGNAPNSVMLNKLRIAQQGGPVPKAKKARRSGPNRPAPARPVVALSSTDERLLNASLHTFLLRGPGTP